MWVKKSDRELEEEERIFNQKSRKKRWRNGLQLFLLFVPTSLFLFSLAELFIPFDKTHPSKKTLTLHEVIGQLPENLTIACVFGILLSILETCFWYKSEHPKYNCTTEKCDKCFQVRSIHPSNPSSCKCGGHFYPIYYYKWIETKKHTTESKAD